MSIDMNKVMADAGNALQRAMVEAAKNEAKNQRYISGTNMM